MKDANVKISTFAWIKALIMIESKVKKLTILER